MGKKRSESERERTLSAFKLALDDIAKGKTTVPHYGGVLPSFPSPTYGPPTAPPWMAPTSKPKSITAEELERIAAEIAKMPKPGPLVFAPRSAEEFEALGLPKPDYVWPAQEEPPVAESKPGRFPKKR